MTINVTYLAKGHTTQDAGDRFVRRCYPTGYAWCLRGLDLRYDIAQGTCDAQDIPPAIRERADALMGHAFSYVEWPR